MACEFLDGKTVVYAIHRAASFRAQPNSSALKPITSTKPYLSSIQSLSVVQSTRGQKRRRVELDPVALPPARPATMIVTRSTAKINALRNTEGQPVLESGMPIGPPLDSPFSAAINSAESSNQTPTKYSGKVASSSHSGKEIDLPTTFITTLQYSPSSSLAPLSHSTHSSPSLTADSSSSSRTPSPAIRSTCDTVRSSTTNRLGAWKITNSIISTVLADPSSQNSYELDETLQKQVNPCLGSYAHRGTYETSDIVRVPPRFSWRRLHVSACRGDAHLGELLVL